jgi:phosphoglycerol transferase MdoB-like AlkP superfamily enzyme
MIMENNATTIETLFMKAENYGKTSIELLKLQAVDKSADVIAALATQLVIFTVVVLFILTTNVGIALWIGEALGKLYYGFFIVAGFYVLLFLLLYVFKQQLIRIPITNSIIGQILNKKLV